jgi:hypothetical protein
LPPAPELTRGIIVPAEHRIRRVRIGKGGKVAARYQFKLVRLGVEQRFSGIRVMLLVADRDVLEALNPPLGRRPDRRDGRHSPGGKRQHSVGLFASEWHIANPVSSIDESRDWLPG